MNVLELVMLLLAVVTGCDGRLFTRVDAVVCVQAGRDCRDVCRQHATCLKAYKDGESECLVYAKKGPGSGWLSGSDAFFKSCTGVFPTLPPGQVVTLPHCDAEICSVACRTGESVVVASE
jgi:hypothetical protein